MSKLIALDDGHGMDTAGKRTPTLPNGEKSKETGKNFMHENEFNRAVVKYLDAHLKRCGFKTLLVAPTDADTALEKRTALANNKKADLYLSVHANANAGKFFDGGGIETYVYPSGESKRIGTILHKAVMKGTKFRDRGVKDGSHLWVIRKTNMPSVLFELGFMDSKQDYKYLLEDSYRRECAVEIAKGVCEAYGVKYVEESKKKEAEKKESAPKTDTHTVRDGETLWAISQKYDISVADLKALNGLQSDLLKIGQVLKVHGTPTKPLKSTTPKKETTKLAVTYKRTLKKGSEGNDVKELQNALNKLYFKCGKADGIFGNDTKDAVTRFQKVHIPKEVDGIAGKNTINKINSLLK